MATFALMTPMGCLMGIGTQTQLSLLGPLGFVALQGVSTGSILYLAIFELLPARVTSADADGRLSKIDIAAFTLGALSVVILQRFSE